MQWQEEENEGELENAALTSFGKAGGWGLS